MVDPKDQKLPDDPEELKREYTTTKEEIQSLRKRIKAIEKAVPSVQDLGVDNYTYMDVIPGGPDENDDWEQQWNQIYEKLNSFEKQAVDEINKLASQIFEKKEYLKKIEIKAAAQDITLTEKQPEERKKTPNQDVSKRRNLVKSVAESTPGAKGKNLDLLTCEELDGSRVPVLESWRVKYKTDLWVEAYEHTKLKGRVQKMFSKDRNS